MAVSTVLPMYYNRVSFILPLEKSAGVVLFTQGSNNQLIEGDKRSFCALVSVNLCNKDNDAAGKGGAWSG